MQSFIRTTTVLPGTEREDLERIDRLRPVGVVDGEADGYPVALFDDVAEREAAAVLVVLFEPADDLLAVFAIGRGNVLALADSLPAVTFSERVGSRFRGSL
jgi:hypothetical protein